MVEKRLIKVEVVTNRDSIYTFTGAMLSLDLGLHTLQIEEHYPGRLERTMFPLMNVIKWIETEAVDEQ
jgi:hypothetical protein